MSGESWCSNSKTPNEHSCWDLGCDACEPQPPFAPGDRRLADLAREQFAAPELMEEPAIGTPDAEDYLRARVRLLEEQNASLRAQLAKAPRLWECEACAFGMDARHVHKDGTATCPNCAEESLRARVVVLEVALCLLRPFADPGVTRGPARAEWMLAINAADSALSPGAAQAETPAEHSRRCGPFCTHVELCQACAAVFGLCETHRKDPDGTYTLAAPAAGGPEPKCKRCGGPAYFDNGDMEVQCDCTTAGRPSWAACGFCELCLQGDSHCCPGLTAAGGVLPAPTLRVPGKACAHGTPRGQGCWCCENQALNECRAERDAAIRERDEAQQARDWLDRQHTHSLAEERALRDAALKRAETTERQLAEALGSLRLIEALGNEPFTVNGDEIAYRAWKLAHDALANHPEKP